MNDPAIFDAQGNQEQADVPVLPFEAGSSALKRPRLDVPVRRDYVFLHKMASIKPEN